MRRNVSAEIKYFAYVRYTTSTAVASIPRSAINFARYNHLRYDRCFLCILTTSRSGFDPSSVLAALMLNVEALGRGFL